MRRSKIMTGIIIGGGYAGVTTLIQLKERFDRELAEGRMRLLMCEAAPLAGPGLAWSREMNSDCQLTNLHVGGLKLSDNLEPSFQDWLAGTYPERFGSDPRLEASFPPRRYFGEYIQAMLARLESYPGITIRTGTEAVRIRPRPGGRYSVAFRDDPVVVDSDFVVVCTGASTPSGANKFPRLAGAPGYLHDPWPASGLAAALDGASRVAVVGTGLTAIDIVKQVAATCREASILMISRRGRFNAVARDLRQQWICDQPPYKRVVLTDDCIATLPARMALESVLALIKTEIEASCPESIDWDRLLHADCDGVEEFRRQARNHEMGLPCRWQLALASLDEVFPMLWRRLDHDERARWNGSMERLVYQNYSNPLPYESARKILNLIDAGRVQVAAGLTSIEPCSGGGFRVRLGDEEAHVSHCINGTGVGFDVSDNPSLLARQLIGDGVVQRHPLGGFRLDPESCAARRGLYFIGNNAKGERYVTSGIRFVRDMAAAAIRDLAAAPVLS